MGKSNCQSNMFQNFNQLRRRPTIEIREQDWIPSGFFIFLSLNIIEYEEKIKFLKLHWMVVFHILLHKNLWHSLLHVFPSPSAPECTLHVTNSLGIDFSELPYIDY